MLVFTVLGCSSVAEETSTIDEVTSEDVDDETPIPAFNREGIVVINPYDNDDINDLLLSLLGRRPTQFYSSFNEEFLATAQHIIVIYDDQLFSELPPSTFGVESIQVNELVSDRLDSTQLVSLIHPEDASVVETLLSNIRPWMFESIGRYSFEVFSSLAHVNDESRLSDLDVCRLTTDELHQDGSRRGFPYAPAGTKDKGTVKTVVIPLDFPDYPGDPSVLEDIKNDILTAEEWSAFMSNGEMVYDIQFIDTWVRLPYEQKYYPTHDSPFFNEYQSREEAINQAFIASDQLVDWETIDFAYFVFPYEALLNQPTTLYGRLRSTTPRAGTFDIAVYGNERIESYTKDKFWSHFVHEALHFQGFVGHGPCISCPLSIMMDENSFSKAILSWEGFLADWYQENHVRCIDKSELKDPFVFRIDSLDKLGGQPGAKNIMVRLSDTKLLIIEHRNTGPYSELPSEFRGIFPYVVDMEKGSTYPQRMWDQRQIDLDNHWYAIYDGNNYYNGMIHRPGSVFAYDGIQVRVLAADIVELRLHE
jgi:hypothetical protein